MSILHHIIFYILKRGQKTYDPLNPPDYGQRRIRQEKSFYNRLPHGIHIQEINLDGIGGEYLFSDGNPKDKCILYIHGGGFVAGSTKTVRQLTGQLVKRLGLNVFSIRYRLAPENPFPAATEDCFAAYCALNRQFGGENMMLMGESAGGTLALATALHAKDEGISLPACVIALAPAVQFDLPFPSYQDNLDSDCIVSNLCAEVQDTYFQTREETVLHHPYAAPYYGDFSGFPPTLLIASDSEVLRDDSVYLYQKLQAAGVQCKLSLFHGLLHTFPAIPVLPESKIAYQQIKTFIENL